MQELALEPLPGAIGPDDFVYTIDCAGFQPDELRLELHPSEMVVQGEKCAHTPTGKQVLRNFVERVYFVCRMERESLRCCMDEGGQQLCIIVKA